MKKEQREIYLELASELDWDKHYKKLRADMVEKFTYKSYEDLVKERTLYEKNHCNVVSYADRNKGKYWLEVEKTRLTPKEKK